MSDASRVQLTYAVEITFAEAFPANAPMTRIRLKSDSLKHGNINVISDELRSDVQRTDLATVGYNYGGDINFELTYGNFFDVALEAALRGTWTSNVLRNGTVSRSFRLEKGWLDIGKYQPSRGNKVNTLNLDISSRQIVQCVVGIMGRGGDAASATSVSGTTALTQPNTNAPTRSGDLIGVASAGTSNIELYTNIFAKAIRLNINNSIRRRS